MSVPEMIAWAITVIIVCATIFKIVSRRLARSREWNTDRRGTERRSEQRRSSERRRMQRPASEGENSSERRQDERRSEERRDPQNLDDSFKSLVKKVDKEGFPSDY